MNKPTKKDEFYIGYDSKAPQGIAKFIKYFIIVLFVGLISTAIGINLLHEHFHYGVTSNKTITLKGLYQSNPFPNLLTLKEGTVPQSANKVTRYYLTPPGKKGLSAKLSKKWEGKYITVKGKLIFRDEQTMMVIKKSSIKQVTTNTSSREKKNILSNTNRKDLGRFTLTGEIVDSKCYLGQMKPGAGKTHKACASLCIRGGLPALFVSMKNNLKINKTYFMLTSLNEKPVNTKILKYIGEPMQITGHIVQLDNFYMFKADPKNYKRVNIF